MPARTSGTMSTSNKVNSKDAGHIFDAISSSSSSSSPKSFSENLPNTFTPLLLLLQPKVNKRERNKRFTTGATAIVFLRVELVRELVRAGRWCSLFIPHRVPWQSGLPGCGESLSNRNRYKNEVIKEKWLYDDNEVWGKQREAGGATETEFF